MASNRPAPRPLVPLALEPREALSTAEAAPHLGRQPQTLRIWACKENGPIRPVRVNGRLAWRTDDLRRLLGLTPRGTIAGGADR